MKKRQEIGRGLRLPVREDGTRCFDHTINRLTVVANESYEDFARKLQTEIEDDCGVEFEGRIANKRERRKAMLVPGWRLNGDFLALWEKIQHRTRYAVGAAPSWSPGGRNRPQDATDRTAQAGGHQVGDADH